MKIIKNEKTILIVDDEKRIRRMLKDYFEINGYKVFEAENGKVALDLYFQYDDIIQLLILDVMMPQKDGYVVLKEIREYSQVPIIMLTAKSEEYNQLEYYQSGADDFLPKPFSPKILMAHVEAIMKRCYPNKNTTLEVGDLILDVEKREIKLKDHTHELSPKEYDLLYYFMTNVGLVLSRETILDAVWGRDYDGDFRTVDTHVKQLRAKLNCQHAFIKTVHGIGYRFEVDDV